MYQRIATLTVMVLICGLVFATGSLAGSVLNRNGSEAATQAPTCTFCPGSGGIGQTGAPVTTTPNSGGVGGSIAP